MKLIHILSSSAGPPLYCSITLPTAILPFSLFVRSCCTLLVYADFHVHLQFGDGSSNDKQQNAIEAKKPEACCKEEEMYH